MTKTPQTDPRITVSMRRDTRRRIWKGLATSNPRSDITTPGQRGFSIARALLPARFRR